MIQLRSIQYAVGITSTALRIAKIIEIFVTFLYPFPDPSRPTRQLPRVLPVPSHGEKLLLWNAALPLHCIVS